MVELAIASIIYNVTISLKGQANGAIIPFADDAHERLAARVAPTVPRLDKRWCILYVPGHYQALTRY